MPILARFHIKRIYLNAGPYLAYTLAGRLKTEGSETLPKKLMALSFHNAPGGFKRWDVGLQVGGGYMFNLKRTSFALDLRYGYGLTNLSRDIERYNRVLNLSVLIPKPWKKNPFAKQG